MKTIGLTGGIGSGKSTVSRFLAEMGAAVIDTDRLGHEVLRSAEAREEIVSAVGSELLTPEGIIDRKKLSKAVFGNAEALQKLNQIMHPRIYDNAKARLEDYKRKGIEVVVIEVPLLIEAQWLSLVDEVWVTVAPEGTIIKRLRERTGMSAEEALLRIRSQLPPQERAKFADVIVDTDCGLEALEKRVRQLWRGLKAKKDK